MVIFLFILNAITNWLVIALLFITISTLSTNSYDILIISVVTTLLMGMVIAYNLSAFAENRRRKSYRQLSEAEYAEIYPIFIEIYKRTKLKEAPLLLISDIAAIIAHEFGHIVNGDTKLKLIEYAINKTSDLILGFLISAVASISDNGQRIVFLPLVIIAVFFKLLQWLLIKILLLGHLAIDRRNEYKADSFVKELGLGNHLISFFEKKQEIRTFPLLRTHPLLVNRIEKLKYY